MNSFRDKLLLSLSLTLILIVAIVTTVIGFAIKSQVTKITRREMQVQNRLVAVAIDQVFQHMETDLRIVSRADVLTGLDRVDMESYLDNVIAENPSLATLAVLTPQGYSVASSGRWRKDSLSGILNQSRNEFLQASNGKRGEVFVAGPVYCGDQPTIIMLCPIIDVKDANTKAVLAMVATLNHVTTLMQTYKGNVSERCVAIIDANGKVLISDQSSGSESGEILGLELESRNEQTPDEDAFCNVNIFKPAVDGQMESRGLATVARLSKRGTNQALDWSVVSAVPLNKLNEEAYAIVWGMLYLAIGWKLILVALSCYLANRITRPIREVAARAKEISQGDLHGDPLPVHGSDEVAELMRCMNDMSGELQKASHTADTAIRLKSEFLANMSHEIRTPMTAILGHTDLLCESLLESPNHGDSVRTIQRNGHHLLDILNDILDVSKLEAGKVTLQCKPMPIIRVIDDVATLMRARAAEKELYLSINYPPDMPEHIVGDETRIRQILINLVGNAIKFTEQGGITIDVRWSDQHEESKLTISISDTGIGIPKSELPTIFDAFSQGDASLTRQHGGTGLGLRISQELALLMGSGLEVGSKVGVGSTFKFDIRYGSLNNGIEPASKASAVGATEVNSTLNSLGKSTSVRTLVADDCEDNTRLFAFLLNRAGFETVCVENGIEAIEQIKTANDYGRPFDIVLMDMQMPLLDGYETTRRLRNAGIAAPIIAITAHALEDDRAKCLDAGCDDYLSKPIENQELVQTCLDWFSRVQRAREVQSQHVTS